MEVMMEAALIVESRQHLPVLRVYNPPHEASSPAITAPAPASEKQFLTVVDEVLNLPASLKANWRRMCLEVAKADRIDELHAGRDEYRDLYDEYLSSVADFRRLAPPPSGDIERVEREVRQLRDELFDRWQTVEDLEQLILKAITPSAEELSRTTHLFPPPQSWYDETDDPFAAK